MNKTLFCLVFDARRGMRVPIGEHARRAGKPASGTRRVARSEGRGAPLMPAVASLTTFAILAAAMAAAPGAAQAQSARPPVVFASQRPAPVQPLPQPYQPRGAGDSRSFVANPSLAPRVSWNVSPDGRSAVFDQGTVDRVVLNWDSFDIGAGHSVHFRQNPDPSRYVSALNRIWSNDPSLILGRLTADREVVLVNANGVYFGRGAVVDTGKFVATALNIADSVFERGLRNVVDGSAVFAAGGSAAADYRPTSTDAAISVEAGAEIRSAAGGDVLLIAPRVVNRGRIETPSGQTVLAAGEQVYLMSSSDAAQRGLLVAVRPFTTTVAGQGEVIDGSLGTVENQAQGSFTTVNGQLVDDATPDTTAGLVRKINEIHADSGAINLVGLAVRQEGNLRATTAVKGANGAIYLQAQRSVVTLDRTAAAARGATIEQGAQATLGAALGDVVLGAASRTEVLPSADGSRTQLDAETFIPSRLRIEGRAVHVQGGAQLRAPAGQLEVLAAADAQASPIFNRNAPVPVAGDGSRIVVDAGAGIDAAGLRDVEIDGARNQGDLRLFRIELADAPVQRSGPLYRSEVRFELRDAAAIGAANVGGAANGIARTARERSTAGGSLRLESEGAVVVGEGARVDISGGSVRYTPARLETSALALAGRAISFSTADKSVAYEALLADPSSRIVPAYDEGKSGGSLSLVARQAHFGGRIEASVVAGEFQRTAAERASPAAATVGRQAGALQALSGIRLGEDAGAAPPPALLQAPLSAPLDGLAAGIDLALPMLQASGLGRLTLRADEVVQRGGAGLDLGLGGVLDIGARSIELSGSYVAPGGRITLRTSNVFAGDDPTLGSIRLAPAGSLSTAGLWTNDAADRGRADPAPVQLAGGTIELSAARSVVLEAETRLDVSGGAQRAAGGRVSTGRAGAITLAVGGADPAGQLELGGSLAAFDFAAGGALTLSVPQLTIGDTTAAGFSLPSAFFSGAGFGVLDLRSQGDILVASGTRLQPKILNHVIADGSAAVPSGPMRAEVARQALLDERFTDRQPVRLSLNAQALPGSDDSLPGASVVVERGASIETEAGGSITLQAGRDIVIGATGPADAAPAVLQALGGEITLRVNGTRGAGSTETISEDAIGFIPSQAIWIGSGATLSVAGTAEIRLQPDNRVPGASATIDVDRADRSLQVGRVFAGGTLTLDAARGYVVAEPGSQLKLDGFAAPLEFAGLGNPVTVARSGGTLNLATPEGYLLGGTISARAPVDALGRPLADGGRLNVSLGAGGVSTLTQAGQRPYPDSAANPRRIEIAEPDPAQPLPSPRFGDDLFAALGNGRGTLAPSQLAQAGFDQLGLRAGDHIGFSGRVDLSPALGLELDAPALRGSPGAQVTLQSERVALGDSSLTRAGAPADNRAVADASSGEPTRLTVRAATIDLVGTFGLQGFGQTQLRADARPDGEIRLVGYLANTLQQGRLAFADTLELDAAQVYATSATRFDIVGLDPAHGEDEGSRLVIGRGQAAADVSAPLSAFGDLRLTATDIEQRGVLRQPFGSIALTATRQLTLRDGSETSVSGDGLRVPFGTTNNLAQWISAARTAELTGPVIDKQVTLDARRLVSEPGARVSARGGGDVQAYEFFPGVGGSRDYFDTPGLYAVLPGYRSGFAPRSEETSTFAASAGGAQIEITMPGSGLAPGRYTLLPARYALLADSQAQGAFVVRLATDQGTAVLPRALAQADGSTIVTGYLTRSGSREVGAPGQRFVVEPPATFRARSEIRLSTMSEFFATRAATLGSPVGALPRDAGALRLRVTEPGNEVLRAGLDLAARAGGTAGTLDVAAPSIALISAQESAPADHLSVLASTVSQSGAGSVLLGGRRSPVASVATGERTAFEVDGSLTQRVQLLTDPRDTVIAEELLFAARQQLDIAPGVAVQASDLATLGARELRFGGDGVVAAVSANEGLLLSRTGATLAGGATRIGAGARLAGRTVQLDSTGTIEVDPAATLPARSLVVSAQRIAVGGPSGGTQATLLDGALLDAVTSTEALELRSYRSIDFVGDVDFARRAASTDEPTRVLGSLVLDTPTVRGVDERDGNGQLVAAARTDIAAREIVLRNSAAVLDPATGRSVAAVPEPGPAGTGRLTLQALPQATYGRTGGVAIGPGAQQLRFDEALLHSRGDITLQGQGSLGADGSLELRSARLTAATGASQTIDAAGELRIRSDAGARSLAERAGQGASVAFEGQRIVQGGWIDVAGGQVSFSAEGTSAAADAVRFEPGSLTRAAGFGVRAQEDWVAVGPAGSVRASAAAGGIAVLGTIDVSAASPDGGARREGAAGSVLLQATGSGGQVRFEDPAAPGSRGQLLAHGGAGSDDRGGVLAVDAGRIGPDAGGNSVLDAAARQALDGGFTREVNLRTRGGEATLATPITAQRIGLTVDGGALQIGAVRLDADASAGGTIHLQARGDLVVQSGAELSARSSRGGANGGDVLLSSTAGRLRVQPGTSIDAGGDSPDDGRIVLRAARGADNASVRADPFDSRALRAGELAIEAVQVYRSVTVGAETRDIAAIGAGASALAGSGSNRTGTLGQTSVRNDSAAFMAASSDVLDTLGVAVDERERVRLRAGVEVQASGNLTLNADWSLHNDRPGGDAGFLTLRAAGNLSLNNSISDGFGSASASAVLNGNARSWSYRLTAGADLASADLLGTLDLGAGSVESGNLTVAAGKLVRTGAGSIELAAGRDIVFGGTTGGVPGGVYVAGARAADQDAVLAALFAGQSPAPVLTERGGRVELAARRDLRAPTPNQFINNWFWRSGAIDPLDSTRYGADSQLAWWSQFDRFGQTVASFGGGNIRVRAGRDLTNLAVMSPSVAFADSSRRADANLVVRNGGDVDVVAGRDVTDGQYFVGRGVGWISAAGAVRSSAPVSGRGISYALIDGRWNVHARNELGIGLVFNPTLGLTTSERLFQGGSFDSYAAGSAFRGQSSAGAVSFTGLGSSFTTAVRLAPLPSNGVRLYQMAPHNLEVAAFGGPVSLASGVSLLVAPEPESSLRLYAAGDFSLGSGAVLGMVDSREGPVPGFRSPVGFDNIRPTLDAIGGLIQVARTDASGARTLADVQTHTDLRAADALPVRIAAGGSISAAQGGALNLGKEARISAGLDIVSLSLLGQHHEEADLTRVEAGRNLLHVDRGGYVVAGPGTLELRAGRQIDLGASVGVASTGNATNTSLPAQGASVRLAAGLAGTLDVEVFFESYLEPAERGGSERWQAHRDALVQFVGAALGDPSIGFDAALQRFGTFPADARREFARRVLDQEFASRYLVASPPDAAEVIDRLSSQFERYRATVLNAGRAAAQAGEALVLPGNEVLEGARLSAYLSDLENLRFSDIDLSRTVQQRVAARTAHVERWKQSSATGLGLSVAELEALGANQPSDARYQRYVAALAQTSGERFERVRDEVLRSEIASTGAAASDFGVRTLPLRLALYDEGFAAAELAGIGNFSAAPFWPGTPASFRHVGTMNLTQSSIITRRGGDISLTNPGGAINVGLKDASGARNAASGVIALGGGNVFGFARDDFQVNNQRVFVVGRGDMVLWSSLGDIDSGRGQNTAVGTPPLVSRRSVDGVLFEVPPTTTGSGLGILPDATGESSGSIGLYPAYGEILALDAFIRAPSIRLGSSIRGADNLQAPALGGAAAPVAAPSLATPVAPAAATPVAETASRSTTQETRQRSSLLTVELLGLGGAEDSESCSEEDERNRRCARRPAAPGQ